MISIRCSEIKKELYFYVKGELETERKSEMENHLKECSACRSLLSEFDKTIRTVDKNLINYPRKNWDFFAEKVLDRIYEKKRFIFWKPALAFALSFFVLVIGYRYFHQTTVVLSDTEELVAYLSDFDIPELNQ